MFAKALKKLPDSMRVFIREAGQLADQEKINAYLVGGFVRDLYLDVPNFDVDVVVEGDGIFFARECARRLSLKALTHSRFGTAVLTGLNGFKADVASARSEIYEKPGALPVVSRGQIKDDLSRRDFTVNAMAMSINSHSQGEMFDFYGGFKDLKSGLIRALHHLSFADDPTRILRAVRFEQRYGFLIEPETLGWIRKAVKDKMLLAVQKHRLRDELVLIFREEKPWKALKRLESLAGFSFIAPSLCLEKNFSGDCRKIQKAAAWFQRRCPSHRSLEPYVMFMCLFFNYLSLRRLEEVLFSYAFHRGESLRVLSFKKHGSRLIRLLSKKTLKPSRVFDLLEPLSFEVIMLIFALADSQAARGHIEDFLLKYSGLRLHVKGEDLIQLGVSPGPEFKKILKCLLSAKVDGKVNHKADEIAFVRKLLS